MEHTSTFAVVPWSTGTTFSPPPTACSPMCPMWFCSGNTISTRTVTAMATKTYAMQDHRLWVINQMSPYFPMLSAKWSSSFHWSCVILKWWCWSEFITYWSWYQWMVSLLCANWFRSVKKTKQLFQILVEKVIQHESYKKSPWQTSNDIALLRLASPAKLAPNVIPVCLPIKKDQVQVCILKRGNFSARQLQYYVSLPSYWTGRPGLFVGGAEPSRGNQRHAEVRNSCGIWAHVEQQIWSGGTSYGRCINVKLAPVARGSREEGFTQPLREKFALLSIVKHFCSRLRMRAPQNCCTLKFLWTRHARMCTTNCTWRTTAAAFRNGQPSSTRKCRDAKMSPAMLLFQPNERERICLYFDHSDVKSHMYIGHWRVTFEFGSKFCAGENSADSCNGDSGGPLVARWATSLISKEVSGTNFPVFVWIHDVNKKLTS